ncbi:MAG TPA: helix-turn-helix domain-containing protein [Jatrophihabitans sp.]|nr:helix-turn-helix domain-containing protein [Jatrophihabitans sp.]
MADHALRKPANRPSRRQDLIAAAIALFSLQPWEFVTVADIVERAGMTPAAFYYHFSSREQLLEEVVHRFADDWVATTERLLAAAQTQQELCDVPVALLDEIESYEESARIFFLSSATAPLLVDRIRRDARNRLIKAATKAVRRIAPQRKLAEAQVNGVSMIVVYETAIRTRLALDEPYRTLGPRRFREEIGTLSRVATGFLPE